MVRAGAEVRTLMAKAPTICSAEIKLSSIPNKLIVTPTVMLFRNMVAASKGWVGFRSNRRANRRLAHVQKILVKDNPMPSPARTKLGKEEVAIML